MIFRRLPAIPLTILALALYLTGSAWSMRREMRRAKG